MNEEERLVKLHIDLPNHWATGGESLWAESLGNNLYKIDNVPFYAYGLNYQDIVRATADSEELKPEIKELVTASGHRTIRLYFNSDINKTNQEAILDSMTNLGVSYERANQVYIALDLETNGDYDYVLDKLDEFEEQGILEYETCEARIEGSFDDSPEE